MDETDFCGVLYSLLYSSTNVNVSRHATERVAAGVVDQQEAAVRYRTDLGVPFRGSLCLLQPKQQLTTKSAVPASPYYRTSLRQKPHITEVVRTVRHPAFPFTSTSILNHAVTRFAPTP